MGWRLTLMGGVEVLDGSDPRPIGGPKQLLLVASLALHAGRPVSPERLVDLIWGEDPPQRAHNTLQASISKLRTAIGPGAPIETDGNRYRMEVARRAVDLLAFEDDATAAIDLAGRDPGAACGVLADLIERWETPLGGLHRTSRMSAMLAPYDELRTQLGEAQCAALIDSGDPRSAVRLLDDLTRTHPTNEKLRLELARGLVALGRRREALDAIQHVRETLRDELGIDVSPQLARFETEVLDGTASASLWAAPTALRTDNLRPEPNGYVGRPEVEQIAELLSPGGVVALVGPGGIGKTRTARAVGHHCLEDGAWSDGIWFVELASLSDDADDVAGAVAGEVATAIGAGRRSGAASTRSIAEYLRGRDVLLVLDNCEHVLEGARRLVGDLFAAGSTVAVLATSRIRLGVSEEQTVPLSPMSATEARELFDARASEAGSGPFPAEDIDRLCSALDCYPLAVELAAARTRIMSVAEIIDRLDEHPSLTQSRLWPDAEDSQALARHASLDLALDWSFAQLGERALATLHRATVFTGDFDLTAAEAVLSDGASSGTALLEDLGMLVEHHLVARDHTHGRYSLLEPIRQTLLARAAPGDTVRQQHCDHFISEAVQIGSGVTSPDEPRFWTRLEHERPHLRDAVLWAAAQRDLESLERAMGAMPVVVILGGEIGPGEWAEDALRRTGASAADCPYTALTAAAGLITAMRLDDCDAVLDALGSADLDARQQAMLHLVAGERDPTSVGPRLGPMTEAATAAGDEALFTIAVIRGARTDVLEVADGSRNPSARAMARLMTYSTLPSLEQPSSLHLVDDCYRHALASNNQRTLIMAMVIRGTSLSRAGDERGAPSLLEALERTLRLRTPQHVWSIVETIAGLLVVMEREPETSAMLWEAVDSTDMAPHVRVLRHPERPVWVRSQLSESELERARRDGRLLDMDAAAREARKAVERFASP